MMAAALVNVAIHDSSCSRTLLSWTITYVEDERVSVDAFYKMALSMTSIRVSPARPHG